jgi:hypothetical protein
MNNRPVLAYRAVKENKQPLITTKGIALSYYITNKTDMQAGKRTILKNIVDFIPVAVGQTELAARTGYNKRTVRQLVHYARLNGELVCSICEGHGGGYYIPLTPQEALPYLKMQTSRISSAQRAIEAVLDYVGGGNERG